MKSTFSTIFLTILSLGLWAQICDGNLGENIFTDGDFGSGTANILQVDPGIAPGYTYTTNVPPFDGFYVITNNISDWPSRFNWLGPSDNSNDPDGYMMVVNASFEPGKFYEQTVTGLCENTLYVFSADIFNVIPSNSVNFILPRVSFEIDGVEQFDTGNIPQNEQWNTYGFTFETQPGQTEVTLALVNKAPGGIGNDLALDNITFRACGPLAQILPETIADVCEDGDPQDIVATITGDQYPTPVVQWQQSFDEGQTWQNMPGEDQLTFTHTELTSGDYYYRYLLANDTDNLLNSKCRVNSNVKIVRVIPKFTMTVDTICDGLSSFIGDQPYTTTGTFIDTLPNRLGCDSIITLDLEVIADQGIAIDFNLQDPSCTGFEDGSVSIAAIRNGTNPFSIEVEGLPTMTAGTLNNVGAGSYEYKATDRYGCTATLEATLIDPERFFLSLGQDQTVDLGDALRISSSTNHDIASIDAQPPLDLDCIPTCDIIELFPVESGSFIVTATSEAGCVSIDTLNIMVNKVRKVFFPNAFTPNNDGRNDLFTIYADIPNVQLIEKLLIFDRWGNLVFERNEFLPNDTVLGWNGENTNGQLMEAGPYVFVTQIRFLDDEVVDFSGSLVLVK